ncbi:hypothetical protein [Nonomuraea sp. NPDC050310]|uniref:hypothetical protein n=1 Tax=Nonomuraea sp. NPDC050310 TaxID=3154935 RepID=UPI0033DEBF4F
MSFFRSRLDEDKLAQLHGGYKADQERRNLARTAVGGNGTRADQRRAREALEADLGKRGAKQEMEKALRTAGARAKASERLRGLLRDR